MNVNKASGHAVDLAQLPGPLFVVQKHAATTLHYDFRLQFGDVLKSWAIPKGPSLDPADKRLAVRVEDHALEYATFEGVIPEGEYGAGTVLVWDIGWWEPDSSEELQGAKAANGRASAESANQALDTGQLKFVLHGQKLKGSWTLVKMRGRGENNWLLIKHRDDAARVGSDIVEEEPRSVLTGRTLEEIAAEETR